MGERGIFNQIVFLICILISFTLSSCNPFASGQYEEVEHWSFSFRPISNPTDNSAYMDYNAIYDVNHSTAYLAIKAKKIENVYGAIFEIVYDSAKIYIKDVKEGDFFKQGQTDTKFSAKYKEQPGKISIEIFRSDSTNVSGNGVLATILISSKSDRQRTTTTIGFNSNSSILIPSDQNTETKWLGGNLIWDVHYDTQSI